MHINFPLILVTLTFIAGLIWLFDAIFFARHRKKAGKKMPIIIDYARSFFPILLIVLIIRSFIVQPFRVPTGSLEPTILTNEFIAVNQFAYGLRLPVIHTKILHIGEPKLGNIVVFRYPGDPRVEYIKRLIGVPGDHIVYRDKVLYINGKKMQQKFIRDAIDTGENNIPVRVMQEDLNGIKHLIYLRKTGGYTGTINLVVPPGMYFMLGDNRDGSEDSRYWGFVPEANLEGKAFFIWLSWDNQQHKIRWHRIGTRI